METMSPGVTSTAEVIAVVGLNPSGAAALTLYFPIGTLLKHIPW